MRHRLILGSALGMGLFAGQAWAVPLVQYEFQGQAGSESSVAPSLVAAGLTGINFGETNVSSNSGANSINSAGWNRAGAAYTFGFTVNSGYTASVNQLILSSRSSATGPGFLSVQASVDGGAYMMVGSITQSGTSYNDEYLSITPLSGITSDVDFRLVAANQTSAGGGTIGSAGTFRVGDYNPSGTPTPFTIGGAVSLVQLAVPEPGTLAVLGFALALFGMRRAIV